MITMAIDKHDLQCMVMGATPKYEIMNNPTLRKFGSYCGGFQDQWKWDFFAINKATESELLEVYLMCKEAVKE